MVSEDAVGIDLGTTNSAIAWIDEQGHSVMIGSTGGDLLTPSVVLFGDGETTVGKSARNAAAIYPDQVAQWVKRDMGSHVYHHPIRGTHFPPEVIQACILRRLREDIVAELGNQGRAVITVPAYFDEPRRKGTADAGQMAGLDVLDIVNEPTAAALAFGERLGFLSESGTAGKEMTVLVYDLGGGTFDVTVLDLAPGKIRTLATDGDVRLGGYDWDQRLVDFLAERFIGLGGPDPRFDPAGFARLHAAAEEAKHTLSARSRASVRVEHAGYSHAIDVTREQFQGMTADLLERTAYTTRQVLSDGGVARDRISRVLLVGGSTRMPAVAAMLENLSGIRPDRTVNPDEAVARGAALYARHLLNHRAGRPASFRVTNVNSHSLGIEGIDPQTLRKTNVVLIPKNSPLPATCTERFATKRAGQPSIAVQVLEGESSSPENCTRIGGTAIRGLPEDLPKGTPIDVTFAYRSNGRLDVCAAVPGTECEALLTIERHVGLSDARIAQWRRCVAASGGFGAMASLAASAEESLGFEPGDPAARPDRQALPSLLPDDPAGEATRPTLPEATPHDDSDQSTGQPDFVEQRPEKAQRRTRSGKMRLTVLLVGYLLSSVVGIGLGYLLIHQFFPQIDLPGPW